MWKISLAALTAPAVFATYGIDLSSGTNEFKCLKEHEKHFVVTRAWHSYGGPDPSAPTNLDRARAAGIKNRDIYMFPCRGKSASSQVSEMIHFMGSHSEE